MGDTMDSSNRQTEMNGSRASLPKVISSSADTPSSTEVFTITKPAAIMPGTHVSGKTNTKKTSPNSSMGTALRTHGTAVLGEFVSTGFLIMLGCMGCVGFGDNKPSLMQVAVAFGFIVMFNIQIFGHVSGAHMNPSVTLAGVILRRMPPLLGASYIVAQCLGAIAGYGLLLLTLPEVQDDSLTGLCVTTVHRTISPLQGLIVEIFLTAILVLLTCAFWDPVNGKNVDSLAIKFGLTITGLSLAGGYFTGASMNPARSLGPAVWQNAWEYHWIYWVGPLLSSAVFSLLYKLVFHTRTPPPPAHPAEEVPLRTQEKGSSGVV